MKFSNCKIIAEIGWNHMGNMNLAKKMVDAATRSGVEIIKHQTHIVEDEMCSVAKSVIPGHTKESIYEIMETCALNEDDEIELKNYVEGNANISTILSTPLINNYLKSNRIKKNFVNLTEINEVENFIKSEEKSSSLMIGGFQNVLDNEFDFTKDSVFYHNPYMNRSWAVIETFQIMRK